MYQRSNFASPRPLVTKVAWRAFLPNRIIRYSIISSSVGVYAAWDYSRHGTTPLQRLDHISIASDPFRNSNQFGTYRSPLYPFLSPILPEPPETAAILDKYFLLKANDPTNYLSWLGSSISHQNTAHLAFNTLAFATFSRLLVALPTWKFAGLILGSVAASSSAWLWEQQRNGVSSARALGGSGMVSGVIGALTMLAPTMRVLLLVVPMPLWVSSLAYVAVDTYGFNRGGTLIGHSAHLGGGAFGVVFYTLFLRKYGGVFGPRF